MCGFLDYEDYADPHNFRAIFAPFFRKIPLIFNLPNLNTSRLIWLFFYDMSFGKYKKHLQIITPPIIIYDFSDRRTDILLHDIQIPIILH